MIIGWLREPLLQFLIVGVLLFALWNVVSPSSVDTVPANRIVLTEDDLNQLATTWVMAGRAPPSAEQMQSLVDDRVREEVLYREALALGLDKDDTIVRRQLARKMEFLADDVSQLEGPQPGELKAWFEKHTDQFASIPRISFRHVYFSPDHRGATVEADAEQAAAQLAGESMNAPSVATAGDPFMFQQYYGDRPLDEIARQFGPQFAHALFAITPGTWSAPIMSGYGWHVVFVESVTPQVIPNFDDIEADVQVAWQEDHRMDIRARLFDAMRARYEVVLPTNYRPEAETPALVPAAIDGN